MTKGLAKLKTILNSKNLDAVLISSIPNIIYLTDFAGFSKDEREAFLLITKNSQYIFTDGRYSHAVKTLVKGFISKFARFFNKRYFLRCFNNS